MNKYIKYIVEGLIDDFDDIVDDEEIFLNSITSSIYEGALKEVEDIIYTKQFKSKYTYIHTKDNKVHSEILNDTVMFYYIDAEDNEKKYLNTIGFDGDLITALKVINILDEYGFDKVMAQIGISASKYTDTSEELASKNVIDFKNIMFAGYVLKGINPLNFICDSNHMKKLPCYDKFLDKQSWQSKDIQVIFGFCYIQPEHINIKSVDDVTILLTYNMNDFSFIQQINKSFSFLTYGIPGIPKSRNFTGLPEGTYSVRIEYSDYSLKSSNDRFELLDKPVTLVGIPSSVEVVNFEANADPQQFLPNMTFEGLTMELFPKFNFEAHKFKGEKNPLHILLGPFEIKAACRRWKPTKPQYLAIIKSLDWFLDCYKTTPHKLYVAPDNDETKNILAKELKKKDAIALQKADDDEDMQLMIKKAQTVIKEGLTYINFNRLNPLNRVSIKIESIMNGTVILKLYVGVRFTHNMILKWPLFIDAFAKEDYLYRIDFKDPNSKTFYEAIVEPVKRKRERTLKKRKEEAKLNRQLEKERQKELQKQQSNTEPIKDEPEDIKITLTDTVVTKPTVTNTEVKPSTTNKTNSKITICDYTDKAIAIYGDYKDMAPYISQLKELGCRYNKFLTINGVKTPGWIISNKKRNDVENIINN